MSADQDSLDPRIRLAGERTQLAWIRTGLAMMGFGFVVARFGIFLREIEAKNVGPAQQYAFSLWIGTALVLLGVAVCFVASWQHYRFLKRFDQALTYQPPRWSLGIVVAIILGVIGLGMALYLLLRN